MDDLERELGELSRRAFRAYDDSFIERLNLTPLAVSTFTASKIKDKKRLRHLVKRHLDDLAKGAGVHLYAFIGSEPQDLSSGRKNPHFHCVLCIKRTELPEYADQSPILRQLMSLRDDSQRWLLENRWDYGLCEIATPKLNGRPVGYAVHKHASNETGHIISIHCPKLEMCQKSTKTNRTKCRVKREFGRTADTDLGLPTSSKSNAVCSRHHN